MTLLAPAAVQRISVIGTGTIGASWAAFFLARGFDVQAWDPAPDAEEALRSFVKNAWPALIELGETTPEADPERLRFCPSVGATLENTDFVQESAPENLGTKRTLYAEIDASLSDRVVLASSTSGLLMSNVQEGCANAARFVVGHPFNPPHLIPLVEVVGGGASDPAAVSWAIDFYNAHGKRAIRLNREVPGHLVNRLQAALWREAADAVLTGLANVEDVDVAIKYGPGLRWGVMGPFELCALAGGTGGFAHFIDHFGDALRLWTNDLNPVDFSPDVRARLKELVEEAFAARDTESLAAERDTLLMATLVAAACVRREQGFD